MKNLLLSVLACLLVVLPAWAQKAATWEEFGLNLRQRGKKYGVKMGKRVLLLCQYEQVKLYKDGYIACEKPTGHYQIFNLKTQAFLSRQYVLVGSYDLQSDRDSLFRHGICQVCSDANLCGFIDPAEHWVIVWSRRIAV